MKIILVCVISLILIVLAISCQQQSVDNKQAAIDSLTNMTNHLKPGLGEFMLQIKYHHDELGKAITNKDYERAAYEIDELKETTGKIKQLNITNDKLQKPFSFFYEKYLESPLNILADAAAKKDNATLRTNFIGLTNNCNSCHRENNMAFMKIGE
jgi:cytochrome c556